MRAKSISDFRKNIAADVEHVTDSGEPLIVTRTGGKKPVLVIPLEQAGDWDETAYLLSSPANAARLRAAINQANTGGGTVRELIEE
ncbi:type II toxin-antitoxin system Phd/YefM family antitoxin [Devosia sp. XJ19-1]|uniref:Antitoxin n=1 Tax=Devosia ureilytica TaxID=2952754 RepID=A0A9Q4AQ91_9HYPH|nr:type II toxin-antitoxin system Phd/YefM family antitoxin [Devosia ureilytica]MCP8884748.1 type II toxin-antitoxin system Phd/YefM family antitoxin [Devosia ureilytica]MCP8888379.1 type II toxin-antitoxin system Phd/YefM family antitoxin [Devosia ureilytica]